MLSVLEHQYEKRPKINPFISTGALMSTLMLLTAVIGTPLFPLEQVSMIFLTNGLVNYGRLLIKNIFLSYTVNIS